MQEVLIMVTKFKRHYAKKVYKDTTGVNYSLTLTKKQKSSKDKFESAIFKNHPLVINPNYLTKIQNQIFFLCNWLLYKHFCLQTFCPKDSGSLMFA